jgi:hypothetical protein
VSLDVILVSYGSAGLVAGCVEAALAFAGERARVVLVDNSPGDGARKAVLRLAPSATIIESDRNVGYAFGVNQSITACAGELVLLLNSESRRSQGLRDDRECVRRRPDPNFPLAGVAGEARERASVEGIVAERYRPCLNQTSAWSCAPPRSGSIPAECPAVR